jgi:predicted RNA binding protein YcfA (HicA-like mRNA interferase family)
LKKKGWVLKKITGGHHIYEKPDESKIISIPVHRNQDLKLGDFKINHENS